MRKSIEGNNNKLKSISLFVDKYIHSVFDHLCMNILFGGQHFDSLWGEDVLEKVDQT